MASYRSLHDGWFLQPAGGDVPAEVSASPVPATVPGCVHTDLLAAGLIPDPYLDDNEERLRWIGRADWAYETAFSWSDTGEPQVDLVCAGLDTVASISLNGVQVGQTANMHRSYHFPVRHLLREGENRLHVRFDSAYAYAERLEQSLGGRPNEYPDPFNFIRKMACNFGWDWGPNLVTAGIWRPIGLLAWGTARLAQVRPLTSMDGVTVHISLDRTSEENRLSVSAAVAGSRMEATVAPGERSATLELSVPGAELWWPRGYGSPARHLLDVTLRTADGAVLDTWQRRIGFRSVRVDTTPDADGTPFTLVVNDVPVFVRGVNWIPDDAFPSRISRDRYAQRLTQAVDANVNLLRIWGGGIYEAEDFYDLADEYGLLVMQDFLFSCAAYPEESPIAEEVEAEARDNVARLSSHPSLVMWIGNNENVWGHDEWDWAPQLQGRTWGAGYYFDLLPRVVSEVDPSRPYWPGSPYSGSRDRFPNDPAHGTMHIWTVWNDLDYTHYRDYRPRFVAEFGYQGPPAFATLRRALSDDPLAPDSPGMVQHQKALGGGLKLQRGLDRHMPPPRDFDDWHYLAQVVQARAVALGVEYFRSLRPLCMGSVMWQLNDCWPVTSWSTVDGDGRRKPLWYALRRAYADRLLTIQPAQDGLTLVAVNDGAQPWYAETSVTRLSLDGQPKAKSTAHIEVTPGSAVTVPLPADVVNAEDPRSELLVAEAAGERAWWFFAEDRDMAYPPAEYDARVEPSPSGHLVTVTAGTILRDLTLYPDRLDPSSTVDDALVTLLPGESATFTVHTSAALDATSLTTPPVLRCVNLRR
jgi:beta-mannosidase